MSMLKASAENATQLTLNGKATIAGAAVAASTPTGLWEWLGVHNESITAACAIIGVSVTVAGFLVTVFRKNKRDEF